MHQTNFWRLWSLQIYTYCLNNSQSARPSVTTGQKATDVLSEQFETKAPAVGGYTTVEVEDRVIKLYRMPSSSRAYPMKLEKKAEFYAQMLKDLGLL